MAAVTGKVAGTGSAGGKKKEVKVMKTIYDMKTGDEVMKTIYDVKTEDEVMETIYDLARNAVTTLVSVTVAALASTQGDVSAGYRVIGIVGMFIFLKWLALDAWDGIRHLVTGRR